MSFILDALRKSEHERQMNAGQNTGMLYQVEVRRNTNPWLIPGLVLIAIIFVVALIWALWPQQNPANTSGAKYMPENMVATQPQTKSKEKIPAQKAMHEKPAPEYAQRNEHNPVRDATPSLQHSNPGTLPGPAQGRVTVVDKPAGINPLDGLPPMNISGYVHNELSGNLAMINNQVVHEGEEVSPGLRLIKVLDDSAIFSYKGYVFTR